jgi:hypothetical protein
MLVNNDNFFPLKIKAFIMSFLSIKSAIKDSLELKSSSPVIIAYNNIENSIQTVGAKRSFNEDE